ncbi:DUF937 domain-containing protein [Arthrobacter sp. AL08]|uniref:DUF937 domain-containing protein n=1 Tax=unclassified Arthrobacter TaxID=235627 RepID=UPI00249AF73B|nr:MULTISPECIES: DUF937 domain-containing protein [unclassified Arthrobacter]MDI3240730.1 DUF937 domain-containing protein [Arthrobacter sp. AL05]MDI3276740.1 DUF937 domain-containing protein [Arthrobacter sp. AL08]
MAEGDPGSELHGLLRQIPVVQIAGMLGTDRQTVEAAVQATVEAAVEAAVPMLLAGMHKNAQGYEGAARLELAISREINDAGQPSRITDVPYTVVPDPSWPADSVIIINTAANKVIEHFRVDLNGNPLRWRPRLRRPPCGD